MIDLTALTQDVEQVVRLGIRPLVSLATTVGVQKRLVQGLPE